MFSKMCSMVGYSGKYGINDFSFVSCIFIHRNVVNMNFLFDAFCKRFSRFRHFHSAFAIKTLCRYSCFFWFQYHRIVLYVCFFARGFSFSSFLFSDAMNNIWILNFIYRRRIVLSIVYLHWKLILRCFSLLHRILNRIVPFQLPVHCSWWFWIIYDEMVFIMGL